MLSLLFAQANPPFQPGDARPEDVMLMGGVFLGCACFVLVIALAVQAFVCYLLSGCLKRIPEPYRQQQPGMVWLLMIPLVGIVWNFFVYPNLSRSYQAYFAAQGRTDVGDCGAGIGLAYCICAAVSLIPYLGMLPESPRWCS